MHEMNRRRLVTMLGGAAIRVMGTAMVTGQAAGVAAALEASGAFEAGLVRETLRAQSSVLTVDEY
jgi:hypothetical protein